MLGIARIVACYICDADQPAPQRSVDLGIIPFPWTSGENAKAFHISPAQFKHPALAGEGQAFIVPFWFVTEAPEITTPTLAYTNKVAEIHVAKWSHNVTVRCLKNAAPIEKVDEPAFGVALTKPRAVANAV